jgi:hypothetical protein
MGEGTKHREITARAPAVEPRFQRDARTGGYHFLAQCNGGSDFKPAARVLPIRIGGALAAANQAAGK